VGGYPHRLRTDCGTENTLIAAIQAFVAGTCRAHTYGTSPGNQRIEAWWSFYRRLHSMSQPWHTTLCWPTLIAYVLRQASLTHVRDSLCVKDFSWTQCLQSVQMEWVS